jgi:hypothetical protein
MLVVNSALGSASGGMVLITPFIISPSGLFGVRGLGTSLHIGRNLPVFCRFCPILS